MKVQKIIAATAVAAVLSVSAVAAHAEDAAAMEKCYGVAKAGKNDCRAASVACAGQSTKDGEAYIALPAGTCERLVGGSLTEVAPAEPAKAAE